MSVNLLELADRCLFSSEINKVSEFLGEDISAVSKGISGVLPAVLSGLINKCSTKDGLGSLMGLVNLGINSGILNNLEALLTSKSRSVGLLNTGSDLVSSILGSEANAVSDAISSYSGLKKASSSSLLSIVTPLMLSLIGSQVKSEGLNLSGLENMILGQHEYIKEAMPEQLSNMLNSGNLAGQNGSLSSSKSMSSLNTGNFSGKSLLIWLLPVVLVLAAGWAFKSCSKDAADATTVRVTEDANE